MKNLHSFRIFYSLLLFGRSSLAITLYLISLVANLSKCIVANNGIIPWVNFFIENPFEKNTKIDC